VSKPIIENTVSLANAFDFIKEVINEVGLVFIAPLDPSIQDEKISKALVKRVIRNEDKQ